VSRATVSLSAWCAEAAGTTRARRTKSLMVAGLAVLAGSAGTVSAAPRGNPCGSERRTVATLQDQPKLLPVRNATLAQLVVLPKVRQLPQTRLADEHRVYRITGQVTHVQKKAGGDARIVISDGAGRRMIVGAPGPACTSGAAAARRRQMAKARTAVKVCSDAVLVGVLFHTGVHHQKEVEAPNGVELDPLLSFTCLAPDIPFGH
jgi:hypothetical protein